jgi:hypothetical protein
MHRMAIAVLCVVLWPALAHAQSIKTVLESYGLMNATWAPDCSRPPAKDNYHANFWMEKGREARIAFRVGPGAPTQASIIQTAYRLSDTDLLMALRSVSDGSLLEIVAQVEHGKYRTKSSKRGDGTFLIRDGKFSSGASVPWLHRCR